MADGNEYSTPLDALRKRLEAARRVREEMATLVGRGESAEGLIKAECTSAGGLTGLVISPRMMRLDSTALAEQVLRAARTAHEDLRERQRTAAGAEFDPSAMPDPAELRARLDDAAATFQRRSSEISAVVDLLRRATGGSPDDTRR